MKNSPLELDTLRSFDPASSMGHDEVTAARAHARMERIMATPPEDVPVSVAVPRRRATTRTRALRWAGGLPAAAAVGWLVSITLPGATPSAFASWTAVASPLAGDVLADATAACRGLGDAAAGSPSVPSTVADGERRGDWSLLVLAGDEEDALICLTTNRDVSPAATVALLQAPNTPDGRSSGWIGSSTDPEEPGSTHVSGFSSGGPHDPSAAPDGIGHEVGMHGTLYGDSFTVVSGEVSPDVTGVTLHANGLSIDATLSGGRYLAWWPRSADLYRDVTYTITFADGTVHDRVR